MAEILGGVAENVYLRSGISKRRRIMSYHSWEKRPPREFRGKPQWTLDKMYISPFTARRWYDEEGVMHYDAVERNTAPTGVEVMDHYLRRARTIRQLLKLSQY